MNILVTGAAGFIGSHVCEYFVRLDHFVIGIDNLDDSYSIKYKHLNLIKLQENNKFHFHEADIRDSNALNLIFSSCQIDIVIHLAAKTGVRSSINCIAQYYDVNVNGTICLLEVMRIHKIKKMIFASSSSIYGNNTKVPFSETDHVDSPISPYASTKRSGELLCYVYTHLYQCDITCLRFFTVFGPRQRPDLAIHKFTRLIDIGIPIPFYGDGSTSRDYTYVDDIVDGINCASNYLNGYKIYNLGESKVINLRKLVQVIETSLGKKAILDKLPFQPGDVNITFADISKSKTEIGYNPKYDFEAGINKFVEWYSINKSVLCST